MGAPSLDLTPQTQANFPFGCNLLASVLSLPLRFLPSHSIKSWASLWWGPWHSPWGAGSGGQGRAAPGSSGTSPGRRAFGCSWNKPILRVGKAWSKNRDAFVEKAGGWRGSRPPRQGCHRPGLESCFFKSGGRIVCTGTLETMSSFLASVFKFTHRSKSECHSFRRSCPMTPWSLSVREHTNVSRSHWPEEHSVSLSGPGEDGGF